MTYGTDAVEAENEVLTPFRDDRREALPLVRAQAHSQDHLHYTTEKLFFIKVKDTTCLL